MSAIGSKLRRLADNIVAFRCPGCRTMHQVWTDRWQWNGSGDAPTFSPSVLVSYDGTDAGENGAPQKRCHSFVEAGKIRFLKDCTHSLASKTVDLPDINNASEA